MPIPGSAVLCIAIDGPVGDVFLVSVLNGKRVFEAEVFTFLENNTSMLPTAWKAGGGTVSTFAFIAALIDFARDDPRRCFWYIATKESEMSCKGSFFSCCRQVAKEKGWTVRT